ncbi:MAG: I78 family peptidase inhibitor [Pseudomonadota bacterium]
MDRRLQLGLAAVLFLSACGTLERGLDPSDYDGVPTCGAENYQGLLGQKEAVLATVDLPRATRILHPGDVITLDFSPDRLTIDVDEFDRITSITCR